MKKKSLIAGVLIAASAILVACSSGGGSNAEQETDLTTPPAATAPEPVNIRVAASATPMTDAVLAAAEAIEAEFRVELVETTGYFTPNVALRDGEVDANFIQHQPHMEDFNEANNAELVIIAPIYYVVGAYFSKEYDSLDALPDGARITIPNDSNEGRALELLQAEGLIGLDAAVPEFEARVDDIISNPKGFVFKTVELMNLNVSYDESDAIFSLGSFARQIGLFPETDGLASEADERFAVSLVARADNAQSAEIEALHKAFTSDEVREVLERLDQKVAF